MRRIALAGFVGAVVLFVWGAISWTVLPWHAATVRNTPQSPELQSLLRRSMQTTGVYQFPALPPHASQLSESDPAIQSWMQRYREGPVGYVHYFAEGSDPTSPAGFVRAFLINIIAAFLAAWLLSLAITRLTSFLQRTLFVASLGLFASLISYVTLWSWRYMPADFVAAMVADVLIGWTLTGVVIAWLFSHRPAPG